jgi:hypothetical protein
MKNKKAVIMTLETIIFLVLNLIFLVMMLMFAYQQGNRYFVYEESYAKQIALLIDNAKPDMAIMMNIEELVKIAKKENKPLNEMFSIDENNNMVKVKLDRGYGYRYFSNYKVDLKFDEKWLTINVAKK